MWQYTDGNPEVFLVICLYTSFFHLFYQLLVVKMIVDETLIANKSKCFLKLVSASVSAQAVIHTCGIRIRGINEEGPCSSIFSSTKSCFLWILQLLLPHFSCLKVFIRSALPRLPKHSTTKVHRDSPLIMLIKWRNTLSIITKEGTLPKRNFMNFTIWAWSFFSSSSHSLYSNLLSGWIYCPLWNVSSACSSSTPSC